MNMKGVPTLVGPSQEDGGENIASSAIQLIGWTPLVELNKIREKDDVEARLIGKLEYYQPLNSVKDRSALRMIEDAEEKGLITPGVTTLIVPTSGNFGIGAAYIAMQKGYKFIAIMPDGYSLEKQMILKYLGADVLLYDQKIGIKGVFDKLDELKASIPDSYVLDQFSNPANADAHFIGTGGKPGKHNIQGIGADLIPDLLDVPLIDEVITVTTEEAMTNARRLAMEEGVLAGISSGAALAASLKAAKREENKGKMIVTIFPSGAERYLSTELFAKVREECLKMTC